MSDINVTKLYDCFEVITSENSSESEKRDAFHCILSGIKSGEKEKRLASQFISRFFKKFEDEKDKSFNCILDLCDDENPAIRRQVVQDLLHICKTENIYVSRVSDVLSQMLATDDVTEAHAIGLALYNLLEIDTKCAVAGIFNQMLSANSESPRDYVIKFLSETLKRLPENKLTSELEEFIVEQTNNVLQDVSETEFIQLISVMSTLKCMSSLTGRQKLVGMITDQVIQAVPVFNPLDTACVAQVRESGKQAVRFLSKNISVATFLKYFLQKVVPNIGKIDNLRDQTSLLRLLAEFSNHPGDCFISAQPNDCSTLLMPLVKTLMEHLPEVPSDLTEALTGSNGLSKLEGRNSLKPFSIECLLYTLLNLIKFCPKFMGMAGSEDESDTLFKEGIKQLHTLRTNIQYTARLIQSYKSDIVAQVQTAFQEAGRSADDIAAEAKRALSNIEALIRCLFRNKIDSEVLGGLSLSWIGPPKIGEKRPATSPVGTPTGNPKQQVGPQQVYHVPAGRWSGLPRSSGSTQRGGRGRRF